VSLDTIVGPLRRPLQRRGVIQTVTFAGLLAIAMCASRFFQIDGGSSPWYPAAGITLAWLLAGSWRVAPLVFATTLVVDWLVTDGARGVPFDLLGARTLAGLVGYVVVATALRRLALVRLDLRSFAWFGALGVIAAPAWSALSASLLDRWYEAGPLVRSVDTYIYFVGDSIGVMTFTPMLLFVAGLWATPAIRSDLEPSTNVVETLLVAFVLVAVPFVAALTHSVTPFALLIALMVPILWVALRRDPMDAAVYLCASTTAVSIAAGLSPRTVGLGLVQVQAIMLTSAIVSAFVVTARYSELRRIGSLLSTRDRLNWSVTHDPVSGALNRAGLTQTAVSAAAPPGTVVALDTGAGSDANRTLGRQVTDELVARSAERLRGALPVDSPVAVLDHDLLAAILPHDPVSLRAVLTRCIDALTPPLEVGGVVVHPELGVGIASTGAVGDSAVDEALFALQESRLRGGQPMTFDDEMHARAAAAAARLSDLRRALDEGEITAYFQPIVRTDDRRIVGVEALARWRHPTRGIIGPDDFVPAAENAGLIAEVGRVVHTAVVRLAAELVPMIHGHPFTFSINTSALELDDAFVTDLIDLTAEHRVDATRLVVEVTESVAIPDRARARTLLARLRDAGMGVSIDDFGTGHSSLSQMTQLPVTELKVDGSFVQGLPGLRDDAVVRTITSLAADLGYDLVAEGVETPEQMGILRSYGVPKVQGYLTGRPMTAQALTAVVLAQVGDGALRPRPDD